MSTLAHATFTKVDKNGDGNVDRNEVLKLAKLMFGGMPNSAKSRKLFQQLDTDASKRVTFDEFKTFLYKVLATEATDLTKKAGPELGALLVERMELEARLAEIEQEMNGVHAQAGSISKPMRNLVNLTTSGADWEMAQYAEEKACRALRAAEAAAEAKKNKAKNMASDAIKAGNKFRGLKKFFLAVFKKYDTDKNGTMSYGEFSKFFKEGKRASKMAPKRVLAMMNAMDKDDNSNVSFEELWTFMTSDAAIPRSKAEYLEMVECFESGWGIPLMGWSW
jgi:Ca2+-binding EF-hand superfamily protein